MGEFADMCLASSDPYDDFERAGSGEGGWHVSRPYPPKKGILEQKTPTSCTIDGKTLEVSDKASRYLMYIRVGSEVVYCYDLHKVIFIRIR